MPAMAAGIVYDVDSTTLTLKISFNKGYSNVNTLQLDKSYVISFETNEEINFEQSFWDMPIKSIVTTSDGSRKRLIADFESEIIVPEVISQEGLLKVTFTFPKSIAEQPAVGKKKPMQE